MQEVEKARIVEMGNPSGSNSNLIGTDSGTLSPRAK
jgi:hypothetical protein